MWTLDETHDPDRRSWVSGADGHRDFPIQNLPLGVFCHDGEPARTGVAIGDMVFDIAAALEAGLFAGDARVAAEAASGPTLNGYLELAGTYRQALRRALSALLAEGESSALGARGLSDHLLIPQAACVMQLPAEIGDYTDFFAGAHHARNAMTLMRGPEASLWPNYLHVPIAYHGRASSVEVSGGSVGRPMGQRLPPKADAPVFGPSERLDYELELGAWMGARNPRGQAIPIAEAHEAVVGFCLLNDWSARDIQAWEAQPLGPFLAKNFATFVSPWMVTTEALAPFRAPAAPRAPDEAKPLPYLWDPDDQALGALDIAVEAHLLTPASRKAGAGPVSLSSANTQDLCWTFAQMVAHHASGGCPLRPGDLFGSGTISGPHRSGFGCLLELTFGGTEPLTLANGETRTFLEDGDEVILRGHCRRDGFVPIGFGECRGVVTPAGA